MAGSAQLVVVRYGAALGGTLAAVLLALVLQPTLDVSPFPIFLAAVTFSAWVGGMGPGLLATIGSVAMLDFLFFAPTFTLTVHYASDAVNLVVFAAVALLISSANARLRTARVRAEQVVEAQRDLERQKDEFLANVSHDLRTPLTAIKHSVEAILANEPKGTPEPFHDLFVNISESADRMAALVDDLLELTRLRAGKVRLQAAPADLRDVVRRAAGAIEPLASARGKRLELELPTDPLILSADAPRLERAPLNLVDNAQKHGRGVVRVRAVADGAQLVVSVTDDGPGIPASEQALIFERFYRADGARGRPGSGLGLPIARAFVELHGGRVWVESDPNAGSTFWIALPRESAV